MLFSDYVLLISDFFCLVLIFLSLKAKQAIPPADPKIIPTLMAIGSLYFGYKCWLALNIGPFEIVDIQFRHGTKKVHNISLIISYSILVVFLWVTAWRSWKDSKQSEKWIFIKRGKWF